jgi:hypothetical protein
MPYLPPNPRSEGWKRVDPTALGNPMGVPGALVREPTEVAIRAAMKRIWPLLTEYARKTGIVIPLEYARELAKSYTFKGLEALKPLANALRKTELGRVHWERPGIIEMHPEIIKRDISLLENNLSGANPLTKMDMSTPGNTLLRGVEEVSSKTKPEYGPFGFLQGHELRHVGQLEQAGKRLTPRGIPPYKVLGAEGTKGGVSDLLEKEADYWAIARLKGVNPELGRFIDRRLRQPMTRKYLGELGRLKAGR